MQNGPGSLYSTPEKPFPTPRQAIATCAKCGVVMLLLSQALAYGIAYFFEWENKHFTEKALKVQAELISVNASRLPSSTEPNRVYAGASHYFTALEFEFQGRKERVNLRLTEPPPYRQGETLLALVNPANFTDVRLPSLYRAPPLILIQLVCAGFAFFFFFFVSAGTIGLSVMMSRLELEREKKLAH
jgi:hypothetical protein